MFCFISSFCFMSLPTAGVVVALIHIVLSMLGSLISIGGLVAQDEYVHLFQRDYPMSTEYEVELFRTVFCSILGISLSYHVYDLLASAMVIIATQKRSHCLLLPWLVGNGIALVIKIPVCFALVYLAISKAGFTTRLPLLVISLIIIQCWIWTAICSLYRSIRMSKEGSSDSSFGRQNANKYAVFVNSEDPAIRKY